MPGEDRAGVVSLEDPAALAGGQIRVLVAEGHALVRAGYQALLEKEARIAVVGVAASAHQAMALASKTRPDVLLVNLALPGLDDRQTTARLVSHPAFAGAAILVMAQSRDRDRVFGALRAGAVGVVAMDTEPAQLIRGIYAAARGGTFISAREIRILLGELPQQRPHPTRVPKEFEDLTAREREVLALVGKGLSNAEIAQTLVISPRTAKTHVSRAMVKLGARHRAQLVVLAYETGLVQPRLQPLSRSGGRAATGALPQWTESQQLQRPEKSA